MNAPEPAPPPLEEDTQQRARRWLRILLLASLACLLVVVCAEFPQPQFGNEPPAVPSRRTGRDDDMIVPGQRVGFLALGLSIAEVEDKLGRGHAKPTQTAVLYRFDQAGLTCAVQRGQVTSILIHNPQFRTPGKTGVGSDADQVVREFGDQYEYEALERPQEGNAAPKVIGYTLHYWKDGIHLNLKEDKVDSILIMAPAGG